MAGKALITTDDSGSGQEVARHGTTGWVTACDPLALADSLSSSLDARVAHECGARALELWTSMDVTWATTIAKLVP
jgi:hypothetical protein